MGPARFHCATLLSMLGWVKDLMYIWFAVKKQRHTLSMDRKKRSLSAVRFELTPTEVDCDLNAAP